jgi:hypothetical protein
MSDSPMLDNRSKPLMSLADYPCSPLIGDQPAAPAGAAAAREGVPRFSRARPTRAPAAGHFSTFGSFAAMTHQSRANRVRDSR